MRITVTVTTEISTETGDHISTLSVTKRETSGNPLFTTRVAHRVTQAAADDTRAMLQPVYGEIDQEWKPTTTRGEMR